MKAEISLVTTSNPKKLLSQLTKDEEIKREMRKAEDIEKLKTIEQSDQKKTRRQKKKVCSFDNNSLIQLQLH